MRRLLLVVGLAGQLFAARADYLNWFIDPSESACSFEGIRFGWYETAAAQSDESVSALAAQDGVVSFSSELFQIADEPTLISYDISSIGSAYSYFVELINYDTAIRHVAYSAAHSYAELNNGGYISYTDMASQGYVTTSLSTASLVTALTLSASGVSPEPSSLTLLVWGLALLGLRRRKV